MGGTGLGGTGLGGTGSRVTGRLSRVTRETAALARRNKIEAVAVLLIGPGAAVYPPVWILGVFLTAGSKKWDIRDKWTGIGAPVLLVIFGTVVVLVIGGKHGTVGSYAFEAWLAVGRLSRVAALAGAAYLLWRLRRGRRQPKQPPWNVPHKLG